MSKCTYGVVISSLFLICGGAVGQTTTTCGATTTSAIADKIANGHAWTEHGFEFVAGFDKGGLKMPTSPKVTTIAEFKAHIILTMSSATNKVLLRNRKAYWYASTGTIVFHDANSAECGSAFRPDLGKPYYDSQT